MSKQFPQWLRDMGEVPLPEGYTWNVEEHQVPDYAFLNKGDWHGGTHEDTVAVIRQHRSKFEWAFPDGRSGGVENAKWQPLKQPVAESLIPIIAAHRLSGGRTK